MKIIISIHKLLRCVLAGLFFACMICGATAQVIQPMFERHTITIERYSTCGSTVRTTNIVTTGDTTVPLTLVCANRGSFNGNVTLSFPAATPLARSFFGPFNLDSPITLSSSISGNWTITNENSPTDALFTKAFMQPSFSCPQTQITNGPPTPPGNYSVSAISQCIRTNLTRVETTNVDYIFETRSDLEVNYRNSNFSGLNGAQVTVVSRYKALGAPYLFVGSTNGLPFTSDGRFPPTSYLFQVSNAGTKDLTFSATKQAPWINLGASSGTIARGQSTNFVISVSTNGLAPGVYNSSIVFSGNSPNTETVPVTLTILADQVSVLSVDPEVLVRGEQVRLRASVTATLQTRAFADTRLMLFDQNSNRLGISIWAMRQTTGTFQTNIFLPEFTNNFVLIPSNTASLVLKPYLADPFSGLNYLEGPQFPYSLADTAGEVSIVNPLPMDNQALAPNMVTNFSADVTYAITTRSEADLALRVFDQNGSLVGTSSGSGVPFGPPLRVRRSDGQRTIRLTTSNFTIPFNATRLQLKAVLLSAGSSTVIKNSTTNIYEVGNAGKLIGLEVVQVVQDWSNSIPLISGKATIVRAHIQSSRTNSVRLTGRLRVLRGGAEIALLPPFNPGAFILATTNAAERRAVLNLSLNFRLPTNIVTGTLDFKFESDGVTCNEITSTPSNCIATVTFNAAPKLPLKLVTVNWATNGVTNASTAVEVRDIVPRLISCYPISEVDVEQSEVFWSGAAMPKLGEVNVQLNWFAFLDSFSGSAVPGRLYYGAVTADSLAGLASGIPGTASSGYFKKNPFRQGRHTPAHEVGHSLGRFHAEFCTAAGGVAFPYVFVLRGQDRPFFGPMLSGDNAIVFGFDTYADQLVSPYAYFEMMSYCSSDPLDFWPSKFTYEGLRTSINTRFAPPAPKAGPKVVQPYLFVRGTVNMEQDTVSFLPFGKFSSAVTPSPQLPGNYMLQLSAANGAVLQQIPFAPVEDHARGPESPTGSFIIPVADDPAIRQVSVIHNGQPRATRSASPNAPTVRVLSPNGGENLAGASVDLQWTANDADGDAVTFDLQFSADNGLTWNTLVVDWPQQRYPMSREFLRATPAGLLRVMASDGFNTASDQSDAPFTVGNHAPEVAIRSPVNQQQIFGSQQLVCEAAVYDVEDRETVPTIQWRSSRDGILGNGRQLFLNATNLSEGTHQLSVSVADSAGATNLSTAIIVVSRSVPQALADLFISQNVVGEPFVNALFTWELTIENRGPSDATQIVITNQLPAGFTVASLTGLAGASQSNSVVRAVIARLGVGETATLLIQGSVAFVGPLTNTAGVSAIETDPMPHDNSEIKTLEVSATPPPRLTIEQSGNAHVLAWPATATGFVLESSATIPTTTGWVAVSGVTLTNNDYRATVSNAGGSRFFRLRRP